MTLFGFVLSVGICKKQNSIKTMLTAVANNTMSNLCFIPMWAIPLFVGDKHYQQVTNSSITTMNYVYICTYGFVFTSV